MIRFFIGCASMGMSMSLLAAPCTVTRNAKTVVVPCPVKPVRAAVRSAVPPVPAPSQIDSNDPMRLIREKHNAQIRHMYGLDK